MTEFAYNNLRQASTMMSPFEALLGYYPQMSYKDNCDLQSKSRLADENATALRDLMKELKTNLAESQERQTFYHNKNVKNRSYRPRKSVWLSEKHIKTKQNPKLEHKYLGPFKILEAVRKQAYRLKLLAKWQIHPVFHISLLERDVTRKEAVVQKIADQLEFEEGEQPEQEIDSIIDSLIFAKEAIDSKPPGLYYLIHWKRETHAEDTWESVKEISHLRRLLKKYYSKNPDKPTATSPPVDKGALPLPMAACSGTKIAPFTPALICSPICKHFRVCKNSPVQLRRSTRHQKPASKN